MSVVGTRPEIIKMESVFRELDDSGMEHRILHTGQHYDYNMDRIFFEELGIRQPDWHLDVKQMQPYEQVAAILREGGRLTEKNGMDTVLVQGDTNTTMAASILARKIDRRLCHIEAGLRSFDRTMPEEVNRIVADHCSDILFAPTDISKKNLNAEGIEKGIHVVGNTVVDVLKKNVRLAGRRPLPGDLDADGFFLITMHRAENVDNPRKLKNVLVSLGRISEKWKMPILFPIHPRTRRRVKEYGLESSIKKVPGLRLMEPTGYFEFLNLEKNAALVITDSGGVQEETCILKVPCVTIRENTERPETVHVGSNIVCGTSAQGIVKGVERMMRADRKWKNPFGDGRTGRRVKDILLRTE